ncbi:MAG: gamma-glutamyl-gamma-aminobutyrate hydrolase family protein [Clostridium sp.]
MKPIIGITTFSQEKNYKEYSAVSSKYADAVRMAGGIPFLIPITQDETLIEDYIESLDGIILTGGDNINPLRYEEEAIIDLGEIHDNRDEFEIKLFLKALVKNVPVLGICRGLQIINVALGGKLYQDIETQISNSKNHMQEMHLQGTLSHNIDIDRKSKLFRILKNSSISVNSLHRQAIKTLGYGLSISAMSDDGIVEAIELKGRGFVLGVQWHPENLTLEYSAFVNIFGELIKIAGSNKIRESLVV